MSEPSAPIFTEAPCPLGCTSGDTVLLTGRDRSHGMPDTFRVLRCNTCGVARTSPRPTPEAMPLFYPDDYSPYEGTRMDDTAIARKMAPWRRALRSVFRFDTQAVPPCQPGRLLDVGCASGAYIQFMAAQGWDVAGIEPSPSASAHARSQGLNVHTGTPQDAPAPDTPYDLVTAWMVVEHLFDPVGTLRLLHGWTRPGGWLAISVPDISALEFKIFGETWYPLQDPTHLLHFTPESIARLLAAAGWTTTRVIHQRTLANLLGSMGNALLDTPRTSALGRLLLRRTETPGILNHALYPLAALAAACGQTGRMTVWARRDERT
ncbi:2-polyprenyl-3-methyl-5-hydroxy-6-metoxy-1,4-benzoquinol methylase [Desulfobaculum xiamenense]|uniref:2-polyprenyl-3-methyl-5-hydroxy-6-metoxy-1, 4-benzoquinol methylase n=1 Tax=Desulfobaculum xiamenense TaxID=995050 RepID=A0A846QPM7_9BACT|nr:class I SAM-dependent methyltransferase [Desulfobaculum xiamenense]NJB68940.1 2-polyprenyl-3-methyl-5-hydroxy-6-metoxy-1,4-benzoquinol methylase [Desulfobaculum xiamenense]